MNKILIVLYFFCSILYPQLVRSSDSEDIDSELEEFMTLDDNIKVDFSNLIKPLKTENIKIKNATPEYYLCKAYESLRFRDLSYSKFVERLNTLKTLINFPIHQDNLTDQQPLINVLSSLKTNLLNLSSLLVSNVDSFVKIIDHRFVLAKLDQQIINRTAIRGNILNFEQLVTVPDNISKELSFALSEIIGRVFNVIEDSKGVRTINSTGSGTMAKLIKGIPNTIKDGDLLNGIITAAHVITCPKDRRTVGVYFIPCYALNSFTGLPYETDINNSDKLIDFLETNIDSYKLKTFTNRGRYSNDTTLDQNNNIEFTNPQFREHEDIVFCELRKSYKYTEVLDIEFPMMNNENDKINFSKGDDYFATGYPACVHYDRSRYKNDANYNLIEEQGLSPLITVKNTVLNDHEITINNGKITIQGCSRAGGQSGGPSFKIETRGNTYVIRIFGCVAHGSDDDETCCY